MSQPHFQEAYLIDATCTVSEVNKDEGNDTLYAGTKRNLADFSAMRDLDLFGVEKAMTSVKLLKKLRIVEVATKQDIDVIIHTKDEEIAELTKKVTLLTQKLKLYERVCDNVERLKE